MSNNVGRHIGYKKCRNNRIVVLEILGEHNEIREDIFDSRYAQMRTSRAKVLDIYNMYDSSEKYQNAFSLCISDFEYKIGEIVEPDQFDTNITKISAGGIHYFLTEHGASNFNHIPFEGILTTWFANGRECETSNFKNGLKNGYCKYNRLDPKIGWISGELIYENGRVIDSN